VSKVNKIALTSGRYDPVSPGHIKSIIDLAKEYSLVKVVILQSSGRRYPVCLSLKVLQDHFAEMPHLNVEFIVNKTHFASVTREELKAFEPWDIYYTGNIEVLNHMESISVPCEYWERRYPYSASKIELNSL